MKESFRINVSYGERYDEALYLLKERGFALLCSFAEKHIRRNALNGRNCRK